MQFAQQVSLWLAAVIILPSCSGDASTRAPQVRPQPSNSATVQNPEVVVRKFLAWYTKNQVPLSTINVVPASVDTDTADIYRVDFKAAEEYLALFRASGFVSEKYLAWERNAMQQADSTMQADPQTDGPPTGFNYDHIVCSQDAENDLRLLAQTKPVVTIKADSARVFFPQLPKQPREGAELAFSLTRHGEKWLIDSIKPIFSAN